MLSNSIHWNLVWIVPLLIFVLMHFFAEPVRWRFYLKPPRSHEFPELFYIFSFTAMVSYLLPLKLGLPVRVWLLMRGQRMKFSFAAGVMAVDGVVFALCWSGFALAGMLYLAIQIQLVFVAGGLLVLIALLYLIGPGRRFVQERLSRKWEAAMEFSHCLRFSTLSIVVGIVLLDIVSQMFRHVALVELVGLELPWISIFAVTGVAFCVGLLSTLPLGLGAYDVTLIGLIVGMGGSMEHGIAIVVINRLASLGISVTLGTPSAMKLGIRPGQFREIFKQVTSKGRKQSP